jgi:hypothetical protein
MFFNVKAKLERSEDFPIILRENIIQDETMKNTLIELNGEIFCENNKLIVISDNDIKIITNYKAFNDLMNPFTQEWGSCYLTKSFTLMRKPSGTITKIIRFIKCMYNRKFYIPY